MCFNLLGLFLSGMMITLCFCRNNYDARFESIVGFEGEGETLVDFRGLKIIGRERVLNGSSFFAVDATDDLKVFCKVFTQEVGVWVPMIYEVRNITTSVYGIALSTGAFKAFMMGATVHCSAD
ncbi:uncharacterized protein Dwil_GK27981 [Drosophila willistoni]|uniref:Transmembrane protein n=1 Tax=Drosophila willistoni TaxID=7260 RepID=A0A0Q9X573_DROWI|nr:uncharacterized protein Dwil_GK27981 [Drosophila willistoni]